jgi:hypothetical protein
MQLKKMLRDFFLFEKLTKDLKQFLRGCLKIAFPRDEQGFSMRFKRIDRSPYRDEDISEIDPFKDREKISHIEGNGLLNTLLEDGDELLNILLKFRMKDPP